MEKFYNLLVNYSLGRRYPKSKFIFVSLPY
jgi:hypothetical protein